MKEETAGCKMANLGQIESMRLKRSTAERHAGGKVPMRGHSCRVQRNDETAKKCMPALKISQTSERQHQTFYGECTVHIFSIT